MGIFLLLLLVLAAVGLPYSMIRAGKAIHEEDEEGRKLFTTLSCICAGYLAVFVVIFVFDVL